MNKYYLSKVNYIAASEEGKLVKVSEQYLVDALSFTECEAIMNEEMEFKTTLGFDIVSIAPQKIHEVFNNVESEEGFKWFKAKINFITLDESKGTEKKVGVNTLVFATDIYDAEKRIREGMKGTLSDYEIASITETKILSILKNKSL